MRMPAIWRRIRSGLESAMRQQVTLGGILFTLALLMVALAAFASANNLLFLLLAAMLATLLISNFISRLGLAGLELDFKLPDHVSARQRTAGRVSVWNEKRWMPSFAIHMTGAPETGLSHPLYFPVIPGSTTISETVEVLFARRGPHRENTFQFTTRFPFGFAERRVQVRLPHEMLVYPCIDAQPGFEDLLSAVNGDMESMFQGRGHDFYRIRPYEALESARHVDWKATAHTGDLQVREFAREQEPLVQIFLDLNTTEENREWFETAVDCCAFLTWRISQRGSRLYLKTQQTDLRIPAEGDVYTILRYLAEVEPLRGKSPAAPHDEQSVQVVFSTAPDDVVQAGWQAAYMVGLDSFCSMRGGKRADAGPAKGHHQRHSGGEDRGGGSGIGHRPR